MLCRRVVGVKLDDLHAKFFKQFLRKLSKEVRNVIAGVEDDNDPLALNFRFHDRNFRNHCGCLAAAGYRFKQPAHDA